MFLDSRVARRRRMVHGGALPDRTHVRVLREVPARRARPSQPLGRRQGRLHGADRRVRRSHRREEPRRVRQRVEEGPRARHLQPSGRPRCAKRSVGSTPNLSSVQGRSASTSGSDGTTRFRPARPRRAGAPRRARSPPRPERRPRRRDAVAAAASPRRRRRAGELAGRRPRAQGGSEGRAPLEHLTDRAALIVVAGCGGVLARRRLPSFAPVGSREPASRCARMVEGVRLAKDPSGRERAMRSCAPRSSSTPTCGRRATTWASCWPTPATSPAPSSSSSRRRSSSRTLKTRRSRWERSKATRRAVERPPDGLGDFLDTHPNAVDVHMLYVAALRDAGPLDKAIGQARLLLEAGDASALAELALCHLAKAERDAASLLAKRRSTPILTGAIADRATGLIALAGGDDALAFQSFLKRRSRPARHDRASTWRRPLRGGAYPKAAAIPAILQVFARRRRGDNRPRGGATRAGRRAAPAEARRGAPAPREGPERILTTSGRCSTSASCTPISSSAPRRAGCFQALPRRRAGGHPSRADATLRLDPVGPRSRRPSLLRLLPHRAGGPAAKPLTPAPKPEAP